MLVFIAVVLIFYIFILRKMIKKNQLKSIYYRDIPTKDTPAYVGKIIKGHVDGNDIISTILELKLRGFINISIEKIKGKERRILSYTGKNKNVELEEHELFLINQLFKNKNSIIFEDYISSKKFKNDFKVFDKMLERRIARNTIKNKSNIKNINKIIFFSAFTILGSSIFYAILQPILVNLFKNTNTSIMLNIIISIFIYILSVHIYVSYINKKNLINNIIAVKVTCIVCFVITCLSILTFNLNNIIIMLNNEIIWYKIIISFISAIITLLYMFNIIKSNDKILVVFIAMTVLSSIFNCIIAMCINIVLLSTYIYLITPKHLNLKQDNYIYEWTCFKKFLEDFSSLNNQEENAILIWERYLTYAISLGVNKKIIKKYTELLHINLFNENYYKKFYTEYID